MEIPGRFKVNTLLFNSIPSLRNSNNCKPYFWDMWNRTVLSILGISAFAWIVYVVFTIGSNGYSPTPDRIFNNADTSVLVVHKPKELLYNNPEYGFVQKEAFYIQVLANPERIQHFYFSSSRKIVILERSKPWSIRLLQNYFSKMGYGITVHNGKEIRVSNGWRGRYHDNYIVLSLNDIEESETPLVDWNFVDRKASLSLVKKPEGSPVYIIENAYTLSDNQVKYISQHSNGALPLVDDQEYFQDLLPASFDTYTFYQKDYLKSLIGNDPLIECMNHGMVILEQNKSKCVIVDFELGHDPFTVLEGKIDNDPGSETKGDLHLKMPFNLFDSDLRIELFNGYALISDDKALINSIIGNYETGNTLAQSETKRFELFANTPKKVSFRSITPTEQITKSYLENSVHTVVDIRNTKDDDENSEIVSYEPIRLDGKITSILPIENSSMVYVTTDANSLHFILNDHLAWSKTLDDQIKSVPVLIPGTQNICLTTATGLHAFSTGGNELAGFPITFSATQSAPAMFIASGQAQIAVVADGSAHTFNTSGKKTGQVAIGTNANSVINVSSDKRGWLAHVIANNTWYTLNMKKKTKIRSFNLGIGDWYLAHYNNNILPVGIQSNKFVRYSENGKSTVLIGNASKMIRYKSSQNQELFFLTQNQRIYVVDGLGTMITQFDCQLRTIEDAYLVRSRQGKTFVGLLDGISNNSYIYNVNGNEAFKQVFEGSDEIVFQNTADGKLLLISGSNGYLFRYPLN